MTDVVPLILCSFFVVCVFSCEFFVFGVDVEEFEMPDVDEVIPITPEDNQSEPSWHNWIIVGWFADLFASGVEAWHNFLDFAVPNVKLFWRMLSFDVPELNDAFGGWLRYYIAVPVWVCLSYIIVSMIKIF